MRLRRFICLALLLAVQPLDALGFVPELRETPLLMPDVRAQRLPPIELRVPQNPLVVSLTAAGAKYDLAAGQHGGTLRTLISSPRDVRYMVVYGYARLVGRERNLKLSTDILEKVEVAEDRVFTLHIRPGHKWSDGHPFTAEDFRYYWEDVANNPDLTPGGAGSEMASGGALPEF